MEVLDTLKVRGEMTPKAEEYPFTPKLKYLTFMWEAFDKFPLSNDENFAISFKRLLAAHIFKKCGKGLIVKRGVYLNFPHLLSVGENVYLDENANLDSKGEITIGNNVYIGKNVSIFTHTHDEAEHEVRHYSPVFLYEDVVLCEQAMVLGRSGGTHLKARTKVLPKSLVPKSVQGIVSGIPAVSSEEKEGQVIINRQSPCECDLIRLDEVHMEKPLSNSQFSFWHHDERSNDISEATYMLKMRLEKIVKIIDDTSDDWPQKVRNILELLGQTPNQQINIILPEESFHQDSFTTGLSHLMFLWRKFETLPISSALTFAIPFRRILAERLFKKCGANFVALHDISFDFPQYIEIGDNCIITEHVKLCSIGGLRIQDNVGIAEAVKIKTSESNHNKPSVTIGKGAKIFTAAEIRDIGNGINIGSGAVIGAMAKVVQDVEENALIVGDPARKIRERRQLLDEVTHRWANLP